MREMLRHLASVGKTVFVSSHLLGEVRQMVDVVGIIAAGRLVREGPMSELLSSQGVVRVRVRPEMAERAAEVLGALTPEAVRPVSTAGGWLSASLPPERSEDLNRALAEAGIYAAELQVGSDLEHLFLQLTQESALVDPDGSFQ